MQVAGSRGGMRESDVAALLKKIPVELGAGKTRVRRNGSSLNKDVGNQHVRSIDADL